MPCNAAVDYFVGKSARILRVPFSHERMCPVPGGPLAEPYATIFGNVLTYMLNKPGMRVILDLHSSLQYQIGATIDDQHVTGGTPIMVGQNAGYTNAQFLDFWMRVATRYSHPNIIYEIANEPANPDGSPIPITGLVATINAGIAGIRAAGKTNQTLFDLNGYNALGWSSDTQAGLDNRANLASIVDPLNNSLLDIHFYPDQYSQGQSTTVIPNFMDGLTNMTSYLRSIGRKAFLGEFAAGTDAASLAALAAITAHIETNRDVWTGWAFWAAGKYQDNYIYQLLPTELTNFGPTDPLPAIVTDRAQMSVLGAYFGWA